MQTRRLKNYTTTLLADLRADPILRGLGALTIVLLVVASVGLSAIWRNRPAAAEPMKPIWIVSTPTPEIRPQPTATPAPAEPQIVRLSDGRYAAFDPARGWSILAAADAPAAAAPAEPDTYQVSNSGPPAEAAPEAAPLADAATPEIGSADWYNPDTLPTADPALCASEAAKRSVWCGGTP